MYQCYVLSKSIHKFIMLGPIYAEEKLLQLTGDVHNCRCTVEDVNGLFYVIF